MTDNYECYMAANPIPKVLFTEPSSYAASFAAGSPTYGYQACNYVDGIGTSIERWEPDNATPPVYGHHVGGDVILLKLPWTKFRIDDHTVDITNFDDGYEGQEITVFVGANTVAGGKDIIHDVTKIVLTSGADITPSAGDLLRFQLVGTVWYQM